VKFKFADLPGHCFINCKSTDFDASSYAEIADINDLEDRCKLRINCFQSPSGPLKSVISIGKINKNLSVSMVLAQSEVHFGDDSCGAWDIRSWHGSKFYMSGRNIVSNGVKCVLEHNSEVSIGEDCMFSDEVLIQCGSQHAVISLDDKRQVNIDKSIINIGNHVWLGRRSTVMSSSRSIDIGSGSILGINSTLTKSIPATSLAVGSPATVVKEKVSWSNVFRCSADELNRVCSMFPGV
jgi:acetyltransferase-like isoleucine patch superfamily enzyme